MSIAKQGIISLFLPATVIILLFYGFFLRFEPISSHSYWMDEGYTINAVLSYSSGKVSGISAILDSGSKYECFLYCFPTALIANQFGANESSFRILSVIFGFLTIFVIYFVTKELFNRKVALLSAFFINFAYFQIAWSAQARWYTMFTVFFWLAILFFIRTIKAYDNNEVEKNDTAVTPTQNATKNSAKIIWSIILTALFTILAIMSQKIGVLLPVFFAGYLIYKNFSKIAEKNEDSIQPASESAIVSSSKNAMIATAKAAAIATAILAFGLLVDILSGRDLVINFIQKINFNYNLPYYLSFFWREYSIFVLLMIWTLVNNKEEKNYKNSWFLIFIFILYLVPLSALTNIVHYRYMFHLTPIFFILGSVGILSVLEKIKWQNQWKNFIGLLILVAIFFVAGIGVFMPQEKYFLEADDPAKIGDRPSYAYTPQPDWNAAYSFIKKNRSENDLIISSHAHFNKIFLGEAGFWIKYDYLGIDDRPASIKNDREYYVGAKVIDDLAELKEIIADKHGFIVFDYMADDGKIPSEIIDFIDQNFELVFEKIDNSYSVVWVFRF
jgi:4-amino-4-deoxy-L-arabinose transferase-like glycosyltransferase